MSNYYVDGYTPPQNATDSDGVVAIQNELVNAGANIAIDGVWGAETQDAYEQYGAGLGLESATPQTPQFPNADFQSIYDDIYSSYGDDIEMMANIEAALRPQFDSAIADIEEQRIANNAAIDVDAASRGMGNSTWVTDAKLQQLKAQAAQTGDLEAQYSAQLYEALLNAQDERDDEAYDRALDWFNYAESQKGGSGGSGSNNNGNGIVYPVDLDGDGIADAYVTMEEYEQLMTSQPNATPVATVPDDKSPRFGGVGNETSRVNMLN